MNRIQKLVLKHNAINEFASMGYWHDIMLELIDELKKEIIDITGINPHACDSEYYDPEFAFLKSRNGAIVTKRAFYDIKTPYDKILEFDNASFNWNCTEFYARIEKSRADVEVYANICCSPPADVVNLLKSIGKIREEFVPSNISNSLVC